MSNRDIIADMGYEDSIVFENPDYDDAIIGVSDDGRVVYSFDRMVESLMAEDNIEEIDAIEFIEYNTLRALPYIGDDAPIVMYSLMD